MAGCLGTLGCFTMLLLAGAAVFIVSTLNSQPKTPASGPTTQSTTQAAVPSRSKQMVRTGEVGILRSGPEHEDVLVGSTQGSYDRLTKLSVAKDGRGVTQMVLSDQVMSVKDGTHAKLIDAGFLCHEVRIVDGPYAGKSAFVAAEFLVPE